MRENYTVSERISAERGESVGDTVGYKIRMESRGGKQSSIMFCTNGILLRVLITNGSASFNKEAPGKMGKDPISDLTHIIVDEIHERDRYSDFMLAILRDLLPSYPNLRLVKLLNPDCKIEEFLQKTLDPPVYETIRNAIIVLQDIGALSFDEKLTELGERLGSLPVHPLTSKMLLISILLNCLDPALTMACASDYRDPFTLPMLPNEKKKAAAAKAELASWYGGRSDQLAVVAAFEGWKSAKETGQESRNCSVIGPLPLLLLATEIVVAPGNEDDDDDNDDDESDYEDADEDNGEEGNIKADLSEAHQGEKIMSSPDNTVKVIVDRWIPFESTALDVAQIYCLRERLAAAILFKVTHPGKVLPEVLAASINAMGCILSYNGMSGISLPHEPVDSLTTMVGATEIGQSDPGWNNRMDMNPNIRHQHPNMHQQRGGGIHVSKGSSAHRGTMQRGHSKRKRGNGPY